MKTGNGLGAPKEAASTKPEFHIPYDSEAERDAG